MVLKDLEPIWFSEFNVNKQKSYASYINTQSEDWKTSDFILLHLYGFNNLPYI